MNRFYKWLKNEQASIILILAGLALIICALVLFFWSEDKLSLASVIDSEKFGQFGDFIGGVVGSIWALAGVILFYLALSEQRKDIKTNQENLILQTKTLEQQVDQFKLQTDELSSSRKVYEQQTKTLKVQQFESNFYSLLNIHLTVKENLNRTHQENDFFKGIYEDFQIAYDPVKSIQDHHIEMTNKFSEVYSNNKGHLAHYFRSFYRILKVINSVGGFTEAEKHFYSKILRSLLTDYEHLVLYYNSHTVHGERARPLILEYNMLKNTSLFSKPHFDHFNSIQGNNKLWSFSDYLSSFLEKHINDSYKIDFEKEKIIERYVPLDCLVGIYFDDIIEVKVFCFKDIQENSINLSNEEFGQFLNDLLYERLVLNPYVDFNIESKKIQLEKSLMEKEEERIFGISIHTDLTIRINTDKH